MAQLLIEIPDEYLPGIEAARYTAGSSFASAAEFASHTAVEAAKSWCMQYKVGPYWEQPYPQFNPDGTPFVPVVESVSSEETLSSESLMNDMESIGSEGLMSTTSDEILSSDDLMTSTETNDVSGVVEE